MIEDTWLNFVLFWVGALIFCAAILYFPRRPK